MCSQLKKKLVMASKLVAMALLLMIANILRNIDAKPVQHQIRFRQPPQKEMEALLGSSISIDCEATSSPQPTIHWLKNGIRIEQNSGTENQIDGDETSSSNNKKLGLSATRSRLFIDCVDVVDEAIYTCVAENEFSRISSDSKVSIVKPKMRADNDIQIYTDDVATTYAQASTQASPMTTMAAVPMCNKDAAEKARIKMWSHSIVEVMGSNAILFCRTNKATLNRQSRLSELTSLVMDLKTPILSWTKPDGKAITIDNRNKYNILDSGDLVIRNLQWSDMGSYVCTVSDTRNTDKISTFVYPTHFKSSTSNKSRRNEDIR